VTILPTARLDDSGRLITVGVRILCQPNGVNGIQWEGFISATQRGAFAFAGLPLVCDGRPHVQAVELSGTALFTPGAAAVNAVIQDENTLTTYASDARTVRVRRGLPAKPPDLRRLCEVSGPGGLEAGQEVPRRAKPQFRLTARGPCRTSTMGADRGRSYGKFPAKTSVSQATSSAWSMR
jgi:hypothetical protein